ncbi:hypothetical protein RRF57_011583 [Xylaria bambusicola]|uniref:Uncharacterized protein n=1 Tax=Xylaria bambusicola TaxID=326684 RepID=A0AAN7ZD91_9PEZI
MCVELSTTPKAPPPPPRKAQKRSGFVHRFAVRTTPSGETILNWRTRSTARPCVPVRTPWPPLRSQPPDAPIVATVPPTKSAS